MHSTFYRDLRKRLQNDLSSIRTAIDDNIQTDKILSPQREKLQQANDKIMNAVDDILGVLSVWNVAEAKKQETTDILEDTLNRVADTATLASNLETLSQDSGLIKYTMENAPPGAGKVAAKRLSPDARARWLEWLSGNDDNN